MDKKIKIVLDFLFTINIIVFFVSLGFIFYFMIVENSLKRTPHWILLFSILYMFIYFLVRGKKVFNNKWKWV